MDLHTHELPIPGPAAEDEEAREILRAWASGGRPWISIDTDDEDGPAGWGIVLVDLARHIAAAYEETGQMKGPTVLDRIKQVFEANWGKR
jgi:hypothetical protein